KLFSDEKIVRDGLSGNPNTPVKLLNVLANDSDKMVRLRVAENPSTPKEVLLSMIDDEDPNVSKAAEIKLRMRA
ncbi:MAG: HEAT repeat domain-containing protein, partial [Campylobacterales bacterium]|nr:HEAT repeat domain-containing protein [Campylobacterales bacterium]